MLLMAASQQPTAGTALLLIFAILVAWFLSGIS
jgi:hypothetical protein